MSNGLHITPDRQSKKNLSEWASTQLKAEVDGDWESSESPMANYGCSPGELTASAQYNGESLDFGDPNVDLI